MKQIFKIELNRAFTGWGMKLSLLIGGAIAVYFCITEVIPVSKDIARMLSSELLGNPKTAIYYPDFLYYVWLGGPLFRVAPETFYFLIFPILAVLPFGDSLFMDQKDGHIKNACLHAKKSHYFAAKYTAVFASGGVAVMLPLLFSFMLSCMFLPAITPEVTSPNMSAINEASSFPWLYYNMPLLFIGVYMLIYFALGGLFACLGAVVTAYVGYRFLVLVTPFIVYMFANSMFQLLGMKEWMPTNFLISGYEKDVRLPILVYILLLLAVALFGYFSTRKSDVF